jgi:hypothetical protein
MKTQIKSFALVLACAFPAALVAETLGVPVSNLVNTSFLFGVFVTGLTLVTLFNDYRTPKPLAICTAATSSKSILRLAA